MERPTIKDKAVLAYVEYLESQLSSQDTVKKFRRGIQRQLDLLADEMLNENFIISLKPIYVQSLDGKMIKTESGFNEFFDMLTKGKEIVAAIEKFETAAYPKAQVDKKKSLSTDSAENYLRKKDATS